MRQVWVIAKNSFMELLRQPVFLLLSTATGFFNVFLAALPYFGFGDDPNMVKNMVLAVSLLCGLLAAVLASSAAVSREIYTGTALAVLSKPVSRLKFILGKYLGIVGVLTLITYLNAVTVLLASRMAYDAYDTTDYQSLAAFAIAVVAAYLIGAFLNYFLGRVFVADTFLVMLVTVTAAFLIVAFVLKLERSFGRLAMVDWRLVPACLILLFSIWTLAAIALTVSTRLDLVPALAVCSTIFVLGLMSDYLFGTRAAAGEWWAHIPYGVLPNWQLFWLADAISMNKSIPAEYVVQVAGYSLGYIVACLCVALFLFEERELR